MLDQVSSFSHTNKWRCSTADARSFVGLAVFSLSASISRSSDSSLPLKVSAEKDAAVTGLTSRIAVLEVQVAAAGEQLVQARAAEQEVVREASVAAARLAAAEARAKTLQEAHDALLDRVAPATPGD
jgi:hypothetical protein